MRNPRKNLLIAALLIALPLAACAVPEEDVRNAENALEQATEAEAPVYAPEAFAAARDTLGAAKAEIAAQREKVLVTRSYDDARALLAEAEEQAVAAQETAAEEKERVRFEASQSLESARSGVDDLRGLLTELAECPRQPKGFSGDLERLAGQADAIEDELATAQDTFDAGDLHTASAAASAVLERIEALSADLTSAKEKIRC